MHEIHECYWSIRQSERHHCKLGMPKPRPEHYLRDVSLPNSQLMIPRTEIYLGIDLCLFEIWDRNKIIIDDIFAFSVAHEIMDDDCEPQSINECHRRQDWPKWEESIKAELASLAKREVFGPITRIPGNVKPVGYKWVFVRKQNEKNEVVRYKARLVAQGFS